MHVVRSSEAECGTHLVECEALSLALTPKLHEILALILHQDRGQQSTSALCDDCHHALQCLIRLKWQGMKEATLLRVLRFTGLLINTNRRVWHPHEGSHHKKNITCIENIPLSARDSIRRTRKLGNILKYIITVGENIRDFNVPSY
jgi:hypothetical protein